MTGILHSSVSDRARFPGWHREYLRAVERGDAQGCCAEENREISLNFSFASGKVITAFRA